MPAPLTAATLTGRLDNCFLDRYRDIGSIMKGVALAAAALVGLEIVTGFPDNWPRVLPWLASLLAVLVSYVTWGRGVLLTNSRGTVWDTILPLLLGIVEVCLFAVLAPRPGQDSVWQWWFLALAGHGLGAALLTHNRIRNTDGQADFEGPLRKLGIEYSEWLRSDRKGETIAGGLAMLFFALTMAVAPAFLTGTAYIAVYWAFIVPFLIIYSVVIGSTDRQRRRIDQLVYEQSLGDQTSADARPYVRTIGHHEEWRRAVGE